jgi:PAS domain-containing protein
MTVGPVVFVEDLQSEQRFRGPELLTVHQVVSGLSVAIPGTRQPYGVLGAHSTGKRIFTSEDGDFLRAVAHILASAIERWHVEARLRERAEEIQTLLDTLPVGVFIAHDPQAQRITGNKAAELLLRSPRAGNLSKTAPEPERPGNFKVCRDGSELPPADLPVQRAARGVFVQQEEVDHVFEDGSVIHTLVSAAPLFDAHNNVRGAVASIMDISGRKKAEQALFEQKERARRHPGGNRRRRGYRGYHNRYRQPHRVPESGSREIDLLVVIRGT